VQFITDVQQKVAQFASDNASTLLTAGGVVGTVATGVLAARGGVKYAQLIADEKAQRAAKANTEKGSVDSKDLISPEDITLETIDKVKIAAVQFGPPILTGSATIAAIIFANRISAQKAAALAAAYGLAERNLSEYKEKVAEKLTGPKRTQVDDELAQDRVNRTDGYQNIVMVEGEVLCFDEPTARYFRSTMENIKSAVNSTNAEIIHHDHANATFFYDELGLPGTTWTDEVGWNTDHLLDLKYSTVISPDGRPCISIDFKVLPKSDYVPKHY